ncbi:hypothetical protein AVEN_249114-1 [Araneus ventricosus]|uniref:Uncharacterized protein n=1 Tax=Araneus ventricosus TaxID=182803 RepID=A0A4Y2WN46_ARAVE|nr:hypothetical protein AVEN_249114-1 [Araneus ventricosus]
MTKIILFWDLCDLVPLVIFGYLLIALKRIIHKEKQDAMKAKQDVLLEKEYVFTETERKKFVDKTTKTLDTKSDAAIQTAQKNFYDRSSQTVEVKFDIYAQVQRSQFNSKSTQTVKEMKHDKHVQTYVQTSDNKETQTSPPSCLDKEVQVEIINSSKVFVPLKKRKPKPTIPLTKEFLKYHQNKRTLQRKINQVQTQIRKNI